MSKMTLRALPLIAAMAFISPVMAQSEVVTAPTGERINQLIIYGDDKCPVSQDEEIVVCARMDEGDRFRIPENLRGDPNNLKNEAWANRVSAYEYVGRSGTMSCTPTGAGGFTGCGLAEINKAYAEKEQDPGIQFGLLIAEARKKRLAGIDAEAAQVEERVKEYERQEAERKAAIANGTVPPPLADDDAEVDAEPLPEPK